MNASQWYIAVAGQTSGPMETEMVLEGLRQGSVPPSAHVCPVGAAAWIPIADAAPFCDSVMPNAACGGSGTDVAGYEASEGESAQCDGDDVDRGGLDARRQPPLSARQGRQAALDWTDPLLGYLAHWHDASLPPESVLMRELDMAPPEVLIQQQAVWNLTICVALGSDALSAKATEVLFTTLERFGRPDRFAWVLRALRGKGFVASEIPNDAAQRAVDRLMRACPPGLLAAMGRSDTTTMH